MYAAAETVLSLCRARGLTLAAAESCTGGLVSQCLTDVPGASQTFLGGVVSYTNTVKAGVLGVPQSLLDTFGAVSPQAAQAMAEGVRRITGADIAVSVTGVAGPERDDRGNPVGLVFTALTSSSGTRVYGWMLRGTRQQIRRDSAARVFDTLRQFLTTP